MMSSDSTYFLNQTAKVAKPSGPWKKLKITRFNILTENHMVHRAEVISVAKDVGILADLANVVADYATLSDDERLSQMFRLGDTVKITVTESDGYYLIGPQHLLIHDTCDGIEITSSLTDDDREYWDHDYFVDALNRGDISISIGDNLGLWSFNRDAFRCLEERLIDHWESL